MSETINKEFETKVLDINQVEIEKRLRELGAQEFPELNMRRYVYDFININRRVIRVRDNGNHITLTFKERINSNIDGTEEIEVTVDDFEKTAQIFEKLNYSGKYYQENKRKVYKLNNLEFCIDTWPMIPIFLEIEGKSIEYVKEGLKLLELEGKDIGNVGHLEVYKKYGLDLHSYPVLKFS